MGRPVNVVHDARCIVGSVGGRKRTKVGKILVYCYKCVGLFVPPQVTLQDEHTFSERALKIVLTGSIFHPKMH